ncbi:AraC family transcriptional regulator [Ktedonosporobacter rubrisoli]|uniref:AraC family transcriptional regulator n=1 Tax=Ktedonosporobacter rubrisoli TaxID=2509675 RepID=A0A4P6JLH3_KTERU|nr:AraC family transcriptional regulator [Ktedonosporobacter rubrisoli]QBD76044.1 AraC family transcriptional regulator [Ktedonosporobacter rubrisoli]
MDHQTIKTSDNATKREGQQITMIRYQEIAPRRPLQRYLKCLWLLEREYTSGATEEILWPDGYVELLIHFGDNYVRAVDRSSPRLACSFVVGPLTRPVRLHSPGRVCVIGARFWPWGFFSFLHMPMHELRDQLVPLSDLIGRRAHLLEERCSALAVEEAVQVLQDELLSCLETSFIEPDRQVLGVSRQLLAGVEITSMKDITSQSGLSLRQLERRFHTWVGVTPKKLSTIRRFDEARQAIIFSPTLDLTYLANLLGYYDHSHFSNDFKTHLGLTPTAFKAWFSDQQASSPEKDVVFLQARPDLL